MSTFVDLSFFDRIVKVPHPPCTGCRFPTVRQDRGVFTTRPVLTGTLGMVASTHWLASGAGMRVLEAGGNAFDAAVAVGFTLNVVEPHMNGLAGDAPIIGHRA